MGKSHALSGGVSWLAGCAVLDQAGARPAAAVIWAGAAIATGFALLPDLDHPGSTVSRTLGPVTRLMSWLVAGSASRVRSLSCNHCTGRAESGHRGLTHTLIGALIAGMAASLSASMFGQRAALVITGFAVWLAAHTALSSATRAKIGDAILPGRFRRLGKGAHRFAAAVGAALIGLLAAGALSSSVLPSWWWIGLPVFWGCLAHALGDALTCSRVPLLWPARIRGCRWAPVGSPRWMRFRTGSRTESVVAVVISAVGLGALYLLGAS